MIKDRGTKKWTSLMLPEHIEMLKEVWEEERRESKPIVDEQQLIENEYILNAALKGDHKVKIEYFADHRKQTIEGNIEYIESLNKSLIIDGVKIELDNILNVRYE